MSTWLRRVFAAGRKTTDTRVARARRYLQQKLLIVERDGLRLGFELEGSLERVHHVMRHLQQ
jgi:hypothetical protein